MRGFLIGYEQEKAERGHTLEPALEQILDAA
jgi:hypothetical protein